MRKSNRGSIAKSTRVGRASSSLTKLSVDFVKTSDERLNR